MIKVLIENRLKKLSEVIYLPLCQVVDELKEIYEAKNSDGARLILNLKTFEVILIIPRFHLFYDEEGYPLDEPRVIEVDFDFDLKKWYNIRTITSKGYIEEQMGLTSWKFLEDLDCKTVSEILDILAEFFKELISVAGKEAEPLAKEVLNQLIQDLERMENAMEKEASSF